VRCDKIIDSEPAARNCGILIGQFLVQTFHGLDIGCALRDFGPTPAGKSVLRS
jgi:hypothetical protein